MSRTLIRVVKIGGSLFDLPDLAPKIRSWLAAQTPAHHILIAGGGPLVDQLRELNQRKPIHETAAHWMCIDLMTVTAHLLHQWLPEIPLIEDDRLLCQRVGDRACTIFGVAPWMRASEHRLPGYRLPASWDVTSDSIAARLSLVLGADELVFIKSKIPHAYRTSDIAHLADEGIVDRLFPQLLPDVKALRLVNFRSETPQEITVK